MSVPSDLRHPGSMCGVAALALLLFALGVLSSPCGAQPLARGKSKFLGCSVPAVRTDFASYWNQVTPENAGKWGSVETSPGVYNWGPLDDIYNYAITNSFAYKHHNLVWGQQQPGFISSMDSATQRAEVEAWISKVAERYGSASFVDVVNEPFHAPPPYLNALGGTGATGWDWVITAFKLARQYFFKGVKLLLNEYNVLQDNTVTGNYLGLIDTLRVRGLIDGIGIQGHYFEFKSPAGTTPAYSYPIATLKANLDRLTATGLPVYITEFDINEAADSTQLQNYQIYFPLFWDNPGVRGMTLWGYVQNVTWKPNAYLLRADGSERPALQWLRVYLSQPVAVSPVGSTTEPRNPLLLWHAVPHATSYRVQVAADSAFSSVVVDSAVTDTLLKLQPLAPLTKFSWHVNATVVGGTSPYSVAAGFATGDQIVSITDPGVTPQSFGLCQNFPNPFNPSTQIRYSIPERSDVSLKVYNILGEEIMTLFSGSRDAGTYVATFDGTGLASGVYVYRLKAAGFVDTKRLVLLR